MAPVIVRGAGARVEDVDGNTFVEYGIGLRSVTLGHAYPPVTEAVSRAIADGVSFSRPQVRELAAAEALVAQIPGADMVKFAKNGSDAMNGAVKLARAATGRALVARCSTQPFFSTGDWFIATTAMPAGTLPHEREATVGFGYNDLVSLQAVLDHHPGQVACIVLEPASAAAEPAPGFLEGVRRLADEHGAVLVFDEMITGMRWSLHGAQHVYGVLPDLSTWGKALGNGFAISALAGRRELMELGGLRTTEPRVFLLSTTYGAETVGLAAYLAVEHEYRTWDVVGALEERGALLADGFTGLVDHAGLAAHVRLHGRPSCLVFETLDAAGGPRRPTAPCSCRSCSSAGCSPSRWSSRRRTPTTTSRGRWRLWRAPSTSTRVPSMPAAPTACCAVARWRLPCASAPSPAASRRRREVVDEGSRRRRPRLPRVGARADVLAPVTTSSAWTPAGTTAATSAPSRAATSSARATSETPAPRTSPASTRSSTWRPSPTTPSAT